MIYQPYHMVEYSPWPLTGSIGALTLTASAASWFHNNNPTPMYLGLMLIIITMVLWWRDVLREGTYLGHHTFKVRQLLKWGMLLFITSEVFFFLAFFWAFFHSSLAPTTELGCCWPPTGIMSLNPFSIPLLNTAVLLSSGVSVTWAHHSLMLGNSHDFKISLLFTVLLGSYFTLLQGMEYMDTSFSIADSVYGSTFFVATGFHGLHVIIGTIFLSVSLYRVMLSHMSTSHHFGFEAAAWYWHFVDVVWIFLYLCLYWWGAP
uniref:cytochrome c oxidase subunit III n=1 Tax=Ramisyllis kingghidorahi TaxID=2876589 RepID=UPI0021769CC7|nr:cytochrome c oxidase subunit III [Ramisyllis kingghidorahi]UUF68153.1 cytochrome c oxidase subunit III [Ramisyllis kingghidorahi]